MSGRGGIMNASGTHSSHWLPSIIIALIGLASSLGSSYIQTQRVATETAQKVVDNNLIPIGAVIGSMLPPAEFYRQAGLDSTYVPEKYTWVLADGRDVTRSVYEKISSGKRTVPDLRGLFLRGINEGAKNDPDGERLAGSVQPDSFAAHNHGAVLPRIAERIEAAAYGGIAATVVAGSENGSTAVSVENKGGLETRPRNAAVYWYIRIN